MSFFIQDNRIWFRHYQIVSNSTNLLLPSSIEIVEIGPRFVLNPIRIFKGSFGGPTLYKNEFFISPNLV